MDDIKGLKFRHFVKVAVLLAAIIGLVIYMVFSRIEAEISEMPLRAENEVLKKEAEKYQEKLRDAERRIEEAETVIQKPESPPSLPAEVSTGQTIGLVEELKKLDRRITFLHGYIRKIENASVNFYLDRAMKRSEKKSIKAILEKAIESVKAVMEGKPDAAADKTKSSFYGEALSFSGKENLMIINMGVKDGVKEGDKCVVYKDGAEIAYGEILSVRYRISAAVINDLAAGYKVKDLQKGCQVSIIPEGQE